MIFESTVSLLEVLPEENFIMFMLMTVSVIFFYKVGRWRCLTNENIHLFFLKVRERAPLNFVVPPVDQSSQPMLNTDRLTTVIVEKSDSEDAIDDDDDDDADDDDEKTIGITHPVAANPAVCRKCRKYAPPRSYHCTVCGACIVRKDHHNVWLDCCIGQHNYRHYFLGSTFGIAALVLGANLALTSICHPFRIGNVLGVVVFLPDDCSEVYDQWE